MVVLDAKLVELIRACRHFDVPKLLAVRRMTLADPESLKWASREHLDAAFTVLLTEALRQLGEREIEAASARHFEPLLPPASEEVRTEDGWLLYSLSRPLLAARDGPSVSIRPSQPEADIAAVLEDQPKPFTTFAELFDDTICGYSRRALSVLAVRATRAHIPQPFYLAPTFVQCFEDVVRRMVLPSVRNSRRIRELGTSRKWAEVGADPLIAVIQSGDARDNVILHQWDARWQELSSPPAPKAKAKASGEMPWDDFRDHALANAYQAPNALRAWILPQILRWEPEALADGWRELAHLYTQEFAPASRHDRARDGAFRDGLLKWIERLPAHGGEALAAKAFFECPKCDRLFLRKVMQSVGADRDDRILPLLSEFLDSLPK
ncbi:MAG: hypothetical protein M0006_08365 [Magnetospirillum sp.]|nr:hypothetical protein [Magnetospirillum sp.]